MIFSGHTTIQMRGSHTVIQYNTVQIGTYKHVLFIRLQYSIILHNTVQYNVIYNEKSRRTIECNIMLYSIVHYHIMYFNAVK